MAHIAAINTSEEKTIRHSY